MGTRSQRRNVFISHHHADDAEVTKLARLLSDHDYQIRNSSIRAKPANQRRLDQGLISERVLERLLRMKISWASCVVVLIGKETHARRWVNWEIEEAHRQGKLIVGLYVRGSTEADIPKSFEKYGTSLVAWNAESIMNAIEGRGNVFQNSDGTSRPPMHEGTRTIC